MSDRTYLHAHVYHCSADQLEGARAALEEWGPWGEFQDDPDSPADGPTTAPDTECDTTPDIAVALRTTAPDASWIAWEEPSTTGRGQAIAFTPALGQHQAQCDAAGNMLLSRPDFEALRARHTGQALIDAIDQALGGPWARHYAAHTPEPGGEPDGPGTASGRADRASLDDLTEEATQAQYYLTAAIRHGSTTQAQQLYDQRENLIDQLGPLIRHQIAATRTTTPDPRPDDLEL